MADLPRRRAPHIVAAGLVALSLTAVGLAGCGGSSSSPSSDTTAASTATGDGANGEPRMSEAAYRTAADKVCADAGDTANALESPSSPSTFKTYALGLASALKDQADGLSGLYPPAAFEAAHQKLVDANTSLSTDFTDAAGQITDATTPEEATALLKGAAFTKAHDQGVAAAKELGLTECFSESAN